MSNTQKSEALRLAHLLELDKWPDAATELRRQHARILELEVSESRTITQRDHCEEVIDRMADAVLGKNRHEWTSNYDYMDAAREVEDRIAELEAHLSTIVEGSEEIHEALTACVNLLIKTPKITRDLYVGKDRKSWGMQAKAVLDAAVSALSASGVGTLHKPVEDGWLQEGPLLYRLTDERRPTNRDEILVTMANSSRTEEARTRRAGELLDAIRAAVENGKAMQ